MKFSDTYIETKIVINNDNRVEYEERNIKTNQRLKIIPQNKDLAYAWGNIANVILFDYKYTKSDNYNNIIKIKDLCFSIEKSIKRGDFYLVSLEIQNVLLPLLDKLNKDDINIIKKANRISAGPLYEYCPLLSTPQIFIDLFV